MVDIGFPGNATRHCENWTSKSEKSDFLVCVNSGSTRFEIGTLCISLKPTISRNVFYHQFGKLINRDILRMV